VALDGKSIRVDIYRAPNSNRPDTPEPTVVASEELREPPFIIDKALQ
jgi:hypothetical protein